MKPLASLFAGLLITLTLAGCPFSGPTAEFSATPTDGENPLLVRFSDLSLAGSAAIETWRWDFGDGADSAEENPVHTYASHGTYRVTLTVSTLFGTDTETKNAYITVRAAPVAAFSATPRSGNTPLAVQFQDDSDGGPFAITSRQWSFGDGETSDEEDPRHVYQQPGAYTVALTVTSAGGSDTESRQSYIQVGSLPSASFRATPTTGSAPLTVQFTDTSTPGGSAIEAWAWTFGDGETSAEQNPEHRYETPGVYTVILKVRNASGETSTTRTNLIRATEGPVAAFRASPTQGAAPLVATFTDESQPGTSPIKSWLWDFGDGTSSAQRNPAHEFSAPGQYDISLTVETDAGSNTISKERYITALAPPQAGFSATPLRGPAPLSVEFRDASTAGASAITTRQWSFGDAAFSGETNPVHVYTTPGRYPVSLTVQSSVGSSTLNRESYIEVVALPSAAFEAAPTSGESPLTVTFTDTSTPGTQPITGWLWEFGDGTTSTDQNPTRVYTGTGDYSVTLTVTTAEGTNTLTRSQFVRVFERADANFTAEPIAGKAPLSVQFRDASDPGSVGINSRSWDFGDGNTSAVEDPLHVYSAPGTYTVSLVLATSSGPDSERKPAFIRVDPSVSFTRTPSTGIAPAAVAFVDTTAVAPLTASAWAWSFGDGATSTLENPSHTYTKAGIYDVTLTVTTEQGEVSATQLESVQLRPKPAFTGTPLSATGAPLAVQFQDETDPGDLSISGWDWNFGDGSHSTARNPEHTFAAPGVYDVSLTVSTQLGNSTTTESDFVVVRPAASFSASPTSGKDSLLVQFTDTTVAGSVELQTWDWNFGDGATSRLQSPSHRYAGPGTYTVALTVGTGLGPDSETKTGLIVIAPEVTFAGSVTSGVAPLDVAFSDNTNTGILETTARSWNFGEGDPSDEASPRHTYAKAGRYDVALTITTTQGETTGARTDYIEVLPDLTATVAVTPGSGSSSAVFTNGTDAGNLTGVSWLWNFGDGSTSTAASPTHVFAEPGIYVVTLALTSAEGVTTTETMTTINVAPVVTLSAAPTNGVAPLEVQFSDTSNVGNLDVTAVLWDFGDGSSSTEANPLHTYATAGTYTATLSLTTALGVAVSAAPVTIEVEPEPNFSGIPRSGPAPLSVSFSNTSDTGGATITGTDWDFGDGATSSAATPSHTYTVPGLYTVTFVLTTTGGTETTTKTDYIAVNPVPSFTADATSGGAPLLVNFTNTTTLGTVVPTGYLWNFGDGATSTDENPSHTYASAGAYDVRLTITSAQGSVSTTVADLIIVEPEVTLSTSTPGGPAPVLVTLTDTSAVGNLDITQWIWDFEDGSAPLTTLTGSASHTYIIPGNYTPTLTIVTPNGSFTGALGSEIVINAVPAFSANLRSGPGALTAVFTDDTDPGNVTTSNRTWSWGDGTADTTTNNLTASHTYAAPGAYTVTLTLNTLNQGSLVRSEPSFIRVNPLTFTVSGGLTGSAPHTISVTNTTAVGDLAITGTQWDYGDGTGQTASGSHTYTTPGTYSISMIAATAQGNRTTTGASPVVVSPVIAHSANVSSGPAVVDVTFTDNTNTGGVPVTSRTWNFGDGTTQTVAAPTATAQHRYTNTGTTAVVRAATVTLNTSIGNFLSPTPVNVTIHPISFSGDLTNVDAPATITFTDVTSTGGLTITSRSWDFKDGGTSVTTTNSASRNFTKAGSYDVELTITTSQGNTATSSLATPVLVRPVLKYTTGDTTSGPVPLDVTFKDLTDTGNLTGISRRWTWGDGNTDTLTASTTTHSYKTTGCYTATMELISNQGTFTSSDQSLLIAADYTRSLQGWTNPGVGLNGIMFDILPQRNIQLNSYTIDFSSPGSSNTIRHYQCNFPSAGFESRADVWNLVGTVTATSGKSVVLDFSNLALLTNLRRGYYLLNRSMPTTGVGILYRAASGGAAASDGNLTLFTSSAKGLGTSDFNGPTLSNSWFTGKVNYSYDIVCAKEDGGFAIQPHPVTWDIDGKDAGLDTRITVENERDAVGTLDGGWAAITHQSAFGPESAAPLLARTDQNMALLWELDLGNFAFDAVTGVVALSDGDLLVWGETSLDGKEGELMLLRLDAEGETRWLQVVSGCAARDAAGFCPAAGGDLLVLSGINNNEGEVPVVHRLDPFSNVLWRTELDAAPNRVNWGLYQRGDGLTTVYGDIGGEENEGAIWEVDLDENGAFVERPESQ
ncbi:MAG: PKD domain-containing protein [Candidatus Hydrogenedentes bacterium]|nr:PKD domain-containing protein [Candidatus Hydrogenedentota bacterium]